MTSSVKTRAGYRVTLSEFAEKWMAEEMTEWQRGVMRDLLTQLEHAPSRKGKPVRGEKNTRIISKGGFRARFRFDTEAHEVLVESLTSPLASIVGEGYSIWDLPKYKAIREQPVGTPLPKLSRDEAWAIIREGAGARPDFPPGEEYVRRVRPMWGDLIRER